MPLPARHAQRGVALLLFVLVVIIAAAGVFLSAWNGTSARQARQQNAAMALQQAKEAVIAHAAAVPDIDSLGYLALPDLGDASFGAIKEGNESGGFNGGNKDYTVIGKLPWSSLGIQPLRDQYGECLWYIVSGRFKNTPPTDVLNWDTPGQIDIIDGNGTLIAGNVAAIVAAPGPPLDGQNRTLADAAYTQCGGNYIAANYLDPLDAANAIKGQFNYFSGSINNRVALDSGNKQFVMADSAHFNDRFLWVTADDIFRPIMRRGDFALQISALFDYFQAQIQQPGFSIAGPRGTDKLTCPKPSFCQNWKEMFFLTQSRAPSPACATVMIFAGQRTTGQSRATPADKLDKKNYLEEPNLSAFATPTALADGFDGPSVFTPNQPWKDIVKCIPESINEAPSSQTVE